jgi:hypothetical protein
MGLVLTKFGKRLEAVEDFLNGSDHGFQGAGTGVICPVPTIPDQYIEGAFRLHLHLRCDGGCSYYCAVSQHAVGAERFLGFDDDAPPVGMDLPHDGVAQAVGNENELAVLIGVLEVAEDRQGTVLRVKPLMSEVVRLRPFDNGHCPFRDMSGFAPERLPGLRMEILPGGVTLVDFLGEDREGCVSRGLVLGYDGDGHVIERRAQVEHEVAREDRQERVVGLRDLGTIDVERVLLVGLDSFGARVATTFLDRRDSFPEVTEVMLCPVELSTPRWGHAREASSA